MRLLFATILSVAVTACAGSQQAVIEPMATPGPGSSNLATLVKEADAHFENRMQEAELRKAIEMFETAYAMAPTDTYVLDRLTAGYYQLGYAYTATNEGKIAYHDRGRQFGLKRLETNANYQKVVKDGGSLADAVAKIDDPTYVHALLLTASNWGWWAEKKGISKVAFDIPKIKALFNRALDLNPGYQCSGPRSMAAAFYAKAGAFGGDMEKAKNFYEESIKDPICYGNRVFYAEFYAVPTDDRELFHKLVKSVVDSPDDLTSETRLENRVAKERAKELLAEEDKLF